MYKKELLEFVDKAVKSATPLSSWTVSSSAVTLVPHFEVLHRSVSVASAYIVNVSDEESSHVVCVAYKKVNGQDYFSFWCSDKFVEGRVTSEPPLTSHQAAQAICEEAVGSHRNKESIVSQMMKSFGVAEPSGKCGFWQVWRKEKGTCVHVDAALRHLNAMGDFTGKLVSTYEKLLETESWQDNTASVYDLNSLAFRVPVMFEGERGAGKTVTARAFARENGYKKVEFGGHEGIESPDMLGFLVPTSASAMIWKDGPISEAFRSAQKQKTVLIIDEILRIRQRELSILLTALSPDEGYYRIRTGRIIGESEGVANEEELECPVENLCVVATTNVGSEYAVDEVDPALAERFVIMRKDTTEEELTRILGEISKKQGLSESVVNRCVLFYKKMTEARARGLVRYAPTTRTLARAINLASVDSDVKKGLKSQILLWVSRSSEGFPVAEQVKDVETLLDRCFGKA